MSEPRLSVENRIIVCGSRDFDDRTVIRAFMQQLTVRRRIWPDERIVIVHGAARGADRIAAEEAETCGFEVEAHPVDWRVKPDTPKWAIRRRQNGSPYDARAGLLRNEHMLSLGCTRVAAFWDLKSRGTGHMVNLARENDARVSIYRRGDADVVARCQSSEVSS